MPVTEASALVVERNISKKLVESYEELGIAGYASLDDNLKSPIPLFILPLGFYVFRVGRERVQGLEAFPVIGGVNPLPVAGQPRFSS